MVVGLVQLNVGDDPETNLQTTIPLIREAAASGARLVLTPEATNILSPSRDRQRAVLQPEDRDITLRALRREAREAGIWLLIGSLALATDDPDGRFANRSLLIAPDGSIAAQYDKLHMFDVTISDTESFRESAAYRPGDRAVLARVDDVPMGMTICYDLRFARLYRSLAQAGAQLLTVPSAFHPATGQAHWETLLRARAIETGCFVLAPAQCGTHPRPHSPDRDPRRSHGHSLVVDPWGRVLADGGTEPGVTTVSLDLQAVGDARSRIPSLAHDRPFLGP
ncbi:carbon-nitrogen hydrolase family protein [Paracoccus sp. 1_MG-2023]|uniref:carbon-nitrogen hydrolase family protein n=1 Tax=unclassified Paracoccus (in: a-proteobacteria) TaxID=2688777 RepID=UPI001C08C4CB|nr:MULTISPECIES: carbon-nitrogen hydrolase family protein [unclassified Paracoccus (in: a-proteobacteria)]MBU2957033.1 carbon-nitrogen hydrolase family protein [Paracoccus sp. C2R09]MDO6668231.1 carbon-nitrogen hydrolase family protein [Paracoccus sp. 1_MG-2023]